ncbi:MAG: hypothetical protein ABR507_02735 [Actinomycetota bacterium]|nr:hypothetical protein [Actinomycetota bacterium]
MLKIISPAMGSEMKDTNLHVVLDLQGARIVPKATRQLRPDEGHVHLSLDGKLVSMAFGLEQDISVTAGPHLLQAEFVAGDHAPFKPRVIVTTTFRVAA